MTIELKNIGKRFNQEWIFSNVDLNFEPGSLTGITGPNGSGKSTLLRCISGFHNTSQGKVEYWLKNKPVPVEQIYKHITIAAPYLEQDEWLTFREAVEIQSRFKPFKPGLSIDEVINRSGLAASQHKFLRQFSSGMKQRVRLTLAILADTDILLLDEPLSNLDNTGGEWYTQLMESECEDRTVIICSNHHPVELAPAQQQIDLSQFKPNG